MSNNDNNKRLAKNTLILYIRMFFMMFISFYTSRVVLNALGVEDFGIYNVVGGLVLMSTAITTSLNSAVSRFFSFGLGQGNINELKKIFSISINIHIILALVIIIVIESLGIWFLNNHMVVPCDRIFAANCVLQLSMLSFLIGLMTVTFNAAIISHEHMSFYAYMSIIDAIFKLIVATLISIYDGDRLILYASFSIIQQLIMLVVYQRYCKHKFEECSYILVKDKTKYKEIFGYAGWNLLGSMTNTLLDQGVNIIVNLFTGPVVNAARGIAVQINTVVKSFIRNFTVSLNPQIIKDYASGNRERMINLIFYGTRLSFYLFMLLSIPVFYETKFLLNLWLGQVPDHTVLFVRLILILSLTDILSSSLCTGQLATGKIRNFEIAINSVYILNIPISYICLKSGMPPELTVLISILLAFIVVFFHLYFLKHSVNLSPRLFLKKVVLNVMSVSLISFSIPLIIYIIMDETFYRFIVLCSISCICSLTTIFYLGCNKYERSILINNFKKAINKSLNKIIK